MGSKSAGRALLQTKPPEHSPDGGRKGQSRTGFPPAQFSALADPGPTAKLLRPAVT